MPPSKTCSRRQGLIAAGIDCRRGVRSMHSHTRLQQSIFLSFIHSFIHIHLHLLYTQAARTPTQTSATMLPPTASNLQPNNILIGIPKKGRLNEKVCKLLDGAGLEYRRVSAK